MDLECGDLRQLKDKARRCAEMQITQQIGVSNCYVFKSRLQEYAQKVELPTPVYETIKEGPSHEPSFRSTVIVNNVRYDSLPGFANRKAAEQSAAEVALVELASSGDIKEHISLPVHETGLCKNLLQEYAQKMNYAIPSYECRKDEAPGRPPLFSCTVEIGGIKYIGAAANTKKEAEIKAARTALLAIQTSPGSAEKPAGNSRYTVIPCKKKAMDLGIKSQEGTAATLKPRKGRFKKKPRKRKCARNGAKHAGHGSRCSSQPGADNQVGHDLAQTDTNDIEIDLVDLTRAERIRVQSEKVGNVEGVLTHSCDGDSEKGNLPTMDVQPGDLKISNIGRNSVICANDSTTSVKDLSKISCSEQVTPMVDGCSLFQGEEQSKHDVLNQGVNFTSCQVELSSGMDGMGRVVYGADASQTKVETTEA